MGKVILIGGSIASIAAFIYILIPFFKSVVPKLTKVFSRVLFVYMLILFLGVSFLYFVVKTNKKIELLYEYFVNPQLGKLVGDIRNTRLDSGTVLDSIGHTSGKRKYPEEISKKCEELRHLKNEGVSLTGEAYYELALLEYYGGMYTEAVKYGEQAIELNPYDTTAWFLLYRAYKWMGQDVKAIYCHREYDRLKRSQQDTVP